MSTPQSGSSLLSAARASQLLQPVRVSVFMNGAGAGSAGRRVVLDRGDSLKENVARIAKKLGLEERYLPENAKVYTKQGIALDDVEEVIEAEVLYFAPRGEGFMGGGQGGDTSFGSGSLGVGASFGTRSNGGDLTPTGGVAAVAAAALSGSRESIKATPSPRGLTNSSTPPANVLSFGSSSSSVISGGGSSVGSSRRRRSIGKPLQQPGMSGGAGSVASFGSRGTSSQRRASGGGLNGASSLNSEAARPPLARQNSFEYDYMFKFVLVGSVAVGKSCMVLRFTDQRFRPMHETTIGVDYGSQTVTCRGSTRVKVQIWDTAGQEYFKAITRAYFREAAAALVVYDVTNRSSFTDLKQWLENVRSTSCNRYLTIMLVGTKTDRPERQVASKEGETFARENGLLFCECSALADDGSVNEVFVRTAEAVLRKMDQGLIDVDDPSHGVRRGDFNVDVRGGQTQQGISLTVQSNASNRMGAEGVSDQCYC